MDGTSGEMDSAEEEHSSPSPDFLTLSSDSEMYEEDSINYNRSVPEVVTISDDDDDDTQALPSQILNPPIKVGQLIGNLTPIVLPKVSVSESVFLERLRAKGFTIKPDVFLGEGSFARVLGGTYKPPDGGDQIPVAAKVIQLERMCEEFRTLHFPRELHIIRGLKHDFITKIIHIELYSGSSLAVIFQELALVDLEDYTLEHYVGEAQMRIWFSQIASALEYCHNKEGVAHRDVKLANILLFPNGVVKLTDFGFAMPAIDVHTGEVIYSGNQYSIGTRMYNAPEILHHKSYNPFQTDIWSLGIALYTVVQNKYPFNPDLERKELWKMMMKREWSFRDAKYPLSADLKSLIIQMLEPFPHNRITMGTVVTHPWILRDPFYNLFSPGGSKKTTAPVIVDAAVGGREEFDRIEKVKLSSTSDEDIISDDSYKSVELSFSSD